MSAHTGLRSVALAPTRNPAELIGASSTQGHHGSIQRDMMNRHTPQKKWGQEAAAKRLPDPAPEQARA